MKYKQRIIPGLHTQWSALNGYAIRRVAFEYYKQHISGTWVQNLSTGFIIHFKTGGGRKLLRSRVIYLYKAELVRILPQVITVAAFNNWGARKSTDPKHVIGYLNFKCKVKINGQMEYLRIAVQLCKNGKLYYNHEVNKWKK